MVTRARKSSEASESRGEAGEEAGKGLSPVSLSANSLSPVLPSSDLTDCRGTASSLNTFSSNSQLHILQGEGAQTFQRFQGSFGWTL